MDFEQYYDDYWTHREEIDHLYKSWVPERVRLAADVLEEARPNTTYDVGCGEGVLARTLTDQYEWDPPSIYECDISENALQHAAQYYDDVAQLNIETDNLSVFPPRQFEAVVCLETLEHVLDPAAALVSITELLEPDGLFISSFPNFVYYKYRLDVAWGRVPDSYTLTDDTAEHIQNFTFGSFLKLLTNTGFQPSRVVPIYNEPRWIPRPIAKLRPQLFANQIVIISKLE